MAQPPPIERSPQEKTGWNYMFAGFLILLLAGAAYFMAPREQASEYNTIGHYLMAAGLAVYITGRIIRYRGRKERERQAEKHGNKGKKGR